MRLATILSTIAITAAMTAAILSAAISVEARNTAIYQEEQATADNASGPVYWPTGIRTHSGSLSGVHVWKMAHGWTAQYKMLPCPAGNNRYTSIPDRDESDTFTLYCEKPQLKIRIGGTDQEPKFRTENATEAAERVRQE